MQKPLFLLLAVLQGEVGATLGEILRFVEICSDFKFADLGADVPIGVVIASISAGVDVGVGGFGERVVSEPQLDLD